MNSIAESSDRPLEVEQFSADYERDGVIVVRELLAASEIASFRQMLDQYVRDRLATLPQSEFVLESDGVTLRNLWRLEQHEPRFVPLASHPRLLALIRSLVRGEPVLVGIETFNKPARVGSGVPYHQDNSYFCQNPPDMLTMWIAIDPVIEANGPVYFIKGSHKLGVLPTKASGVRGNSIGMATAPSIPLSEQFCALLSPGDATIHHCNTIHHSAPNTTDRSRLGLLFVFRSSHTRTDPALQAIYAAAKSAV
jgi:ectoine hydroxylase-related dioxygenase (phytanoyl-CoA dioxygenase family)